MPPLPASGQDMRLGRSPDAPAARRCVGRAGGGGGRASAVGDRPFKRPIDAWHLGSDAHDRRGRASVDGHGVGHCAAPGDTGHRAHGGAAQPFVQRTGAPTPLERAPPEIRLSRLSLTHTLPHTRSPPACIVCACAGSMCRALVSCRAANSCAPPRRFSPRALRPRVRLRSSEPHSTVAPCRCPSGRERLSSFRGHVSPLSLSQTSAGAVA